MEKQLNKVQEHFNRVFKNGLSDEDFEELKIVLKKWLAKKLANSMDNDLKNK